MITEYPLLLKSNENRKDQLPGCLISLARPFLGNDLRWLVPIYWHLVLFRRKDSTDFFENRISLENRSGPPSGKMENREHFVESWKKYCLVKSLLPALNVLMQIKYMRC